MKKTILTIATLATMTISAHIEVFHTHHKNAVYEACEAKIHYTVLNDDAAGDADEACMQEQADCEADTLDYCLDSTLNVDDELEFCGKLVDLHCDMGVITTEQVTEAINNSEIRG